MPNIKIKQIQPEDTWSIRHEILWPDHSFDFVKLEEDEEGLHFGVYLDYELVTIVSLFIKNGEAQFRKLATLENRQGRGYGSILLNHVIQVARDKQTSKIWCNARVDKTGFYHRFELYETDMKFVKEGIDYVVMEKIF